MDDWPSWTILRLKILRKRKSAWIDNFLEENDVIFVRLMTALEKEKK